MTALTSNLLTSIQDNFDRISYAKGSMLIRMMEDFLTSEIFFSALTQYFKVMLRYRWLMFATSSGFYDRSSFI
jgi:aminopeptidase N